MKNGPYILVKAPLEYPGKVYKGRYVYEHQLVWWLNTKILVPEGYIIHHKDEDKHNNTFSNLELKTSLQHIKEHNEERKAIPVANNCHWCGVLHFLVPRNYRFKVAKGKKYFFCSQKCGALHQHRNGKALKFTICGTVSRYRQGCRCTDCKRANRDKGRQYRNNPK